jgi:peptide subunit release factor 1 (eRF1)
LTTTDGARQPDGSDDQLTAEVERILAVAVAQESTSLLETFYQELGQGDRAVAGAADVLAALFRSQVEALLVYDHLDDDRRAWFGQDPSHAAVTEKTLAELGVEATEGRLVDVAVRAALGTGARVRVIPEESGIAEGLGAVLRWS